MSNYTVKQLSKLAGVSIRTLHHYDEIGLLKPEFRGESRYRYYGQGELLRLQQILFYRELEYPLKEIKSILDDPEFDLVESLQFHRKELKKRTERLSSLLTTIDKTIVKLKKKEEMKVEEMYEGFSDEQVKEMRSEAMNNWGEDQVLAAEERVRKMGKEEYKKVQENGDAVCTRLAKMMDLDPAHPDVQKEVKNYHQHLCAFYEVSLERYKGLGEMYVSDERFTAHFEKFGEGLAEFLNKGIQVFCENEGK